MAVQRFSGLSTSALPSALRAQVFVESVGPLLQDSTTDADKWTSTLRTRRVRGRAYLMALVAPLPEPEARDGGVLVVKHSSP